MTAPTRNTGEFTGRHMLGVMLAFFGTIIAVNVTLATFASTSWTGLVVENAYVASQEFNEHAAAGKAQAALGWTGSLAIAGGAIRYRLTDASGTPVPMHGVTVKFRRPAYEAEDRTLALARDPDGAFAIAETVRDGIWIVETDADIEGQKPYRDVHRIVVSNGELQ
jgi:nitrogen fixation protein FixH